MRFSLRFTVSLRFSFRCAATCLLLPATCLLPPPLLAAASHVAPGQAASSAPTPNQPPPAQKAQTPPANATPATPAALPSSPSDARAARLKTEVADLNDLAAKLQQQLDKSGNNQLSLDVVHTTEQIQSLSRQIEMELRTP